MSGKNAPIFLLRRVFTAVAAVGWRVKEGVRNIYFLQTCPDSPPPLQFYGHIGKVGVYMGGGGARCMVCKLVCSLYVLEQIHPFKRKTKNLYFFNI